MLELTAVSTPWLLKCDALEDIAGTAKLRIEAHVPVNDTSRPIGPRFDIFMEIVVIE